MVLVLLAAPLLTGFVRKAEGAARAPQGPPVIQPCATSCG